MHKLDIFACGLQLHSRETMLKLDIIELNLQQHSRETMLTLYIIGLSLLQHSKENMSPSYLHISKDVHSMMSDAFLVPTLACRSH